MSISLNRILSILEQLQEIILRWWENAKHNRIHVERAQDRR